MVYLLVLLMVGTFFYNAVLRFLGYDLNAPHIVITMNIEYGIQGQEIRGHMRVTEEQQQGVYQYIQAHVQDTYPGSLVTMAGSELMCLLSMEHEEDIEQIRVDF